MWGDRGCGTHTHLGRVLLELSAQLDEFFPGGLRVILLLGYLRRLSVQLSLRRGEAGESCYLLWEGRGLYIPESLVWKTPAKT